MRYEGQCSQQQWRSDKQERGVGDKNRGGTQNGGRVRGMETMGSALSCSARSARGWKWGAGKIKRKGNRSTFAFAGVAIATEETLTPVRHNIRESSTSRKG